MEPVVAQRRLQSWISRIPWVMLVNGFAKGDEVKLTLAFSLQQACCPPLRIPHVRTENA